MLQTNKDDNEKAHIRLGRLSGVLVLFQLLGLIIPFVTLEKLVGTDFLHLAASNAKIYQIAAVWLVINASIAAVLGWILKSHLPKKRRYAGWAVFAAGLLLACIQTLDTFYLFKMLALSQQAVAEGSTASLQQMALNMRATRFGVHTSWIATIDLWYFLFYGALFRMRLTHPIVASLGLLTTILHVIGITIPILIGSKVIVAMGASPALSGLVTSVWLLVCGFSPRSSQDQDAA